MGEWPHGVVHMGRAARPVGDREAGLLVAGIRWAKRKDQAGMERRFHTGRRSRNLGRNRQEPRIPCGCLKKALEQVHGRRLDPLDWMDAAAHVANEWPFEVDAKNFSARIQ